MSNRSVSFPDPERSAGSVAVTVTYSSRHMPIRSPRSRYWTGVKPVYPSSARTHPFKSLERSATRHSTSKSSSDVMYRSFVNSWNARNKTSISESLADKIRLTPSRFACSFNASGDTPYWYSSESMDFTPAIKPGRFKWEENSNSSFFFSPASFRSTIVFPMSSRISGWGIESSEKIR